MLKLSDLAVRPDFTLGPLAVSPSRRRIAGPEGEIHLEPLIMQVFLLLLDARGRVVTRTELFDQCWGGVMVGDDSLNRAVAKVRRIASEVAPGLFEIETIPRTGYRLTGELLALTEGDPGEIDPAGPGMSVSRRALIAGGAIVAASLAGGLIWVRDRSDPQVNSLLEDGRRIIRENWPGSEQAAVNSFRKATSLDPGNAEAWGLLALAWRNMVEGTQPAQVSIALKNCEASARRALSINPKEPNARTALATLRPEFGNWGATEDNLRAVLKDSPENLPALTYLVMVIQSVGRAYESFALNERAIALEPLSPIHHFRKGLKLWILDRVPQADLTIDRALQIWPRHPAVWNARMLIFAFTNRADAALAMIEDEDSRPALPPAVFENFRPALRALRSRAPHDIAAARTASVTAAPLGPGFATWAIMALSALGDLDSAFAVAEGSLLRRGPLIGKIWATPEGVRINDQVWRRTMNLWTPACASMRADPRFSSLCDGIGLTQYWRRRGVGPDGFLMQA